MSKTEIAKRLIAIAIGAAIMGFSINAFNIANNLTEGGVAGISILLKMTFDLDPGLSVLLINIPLLLWGLRELGLRAMIFTIYGTVCLSVSLWAFNHVRYPMDDLLLAALYAGIFLGLGLGLIFRYGGTTGGADIVSRVIHKRTGTSTGTAMFYADIAVLAAAAYFLPLPQVMYTLVAVFVGSRVIDLVESGAYRAKALMVISERDEEITQCILTEMNRGVTMLRGIGGYTRKEKGVLYIVCGRRQVVRVKRLIQQADAHAFVTVMDVHEVMGEGFARQG